ncbi:DNA repair protein complementing XP-A cells-like protein [Dirofilaria immitis]|nr:DNA repair protein complementing XP-A cells-like protein [Dirofilaria immitis]
MKRQRIENHVNNGDGYISYVEKLYRKTQENYEEAGGFMDDDDEYASIRERIAEARQKRIDEAAANSSSLVPPDNCIDCKKSLCNSYLWEKFNYPVCDTCRNDKGAHKLISRTEAKNQYLLKDCDFDLRKPILRFISKRIHTILVMLEQRCLEVYGSKEEFEKAKKRVHGSKIFKTGYGKAHDHVFGDEAYDSKKDEYWKICKICGYKLTYEKM